MVSQLLDEQPKSICVCLNLARVLVLAAGNADEGLKKLESVAVVQILIVKFHAPLVNVSARGDELRVDDSLGTRVRCVVHLVGDLYLVHEVCKDQQRNRWEI